jgi:hypothetical protein
MKVPSEQKAVLQVAERLAQLVNVDQSEVRIDMSHEASHLDGILDIGPFTFVVEWKASGMAGSVAKGIEQVRREAANIKGAVSLVAVPFMGDAGRQHCAAAGIAWLDLSGNARIFAPGLHILVEGKPNLFKRRGRPSSAFAPKSSRITRWLLMHPEAPLTQREIARATDTDEGYTSKVVGRLEHDGLIVKDRDGAIKARDPGLLLEAWRETYDFSKHHIIRGHVAARSGDALLRNMADSLNDASVEFAVTGLAAAWLLDRFVGFRIATIYLAVDPPPELLNALSFREEDRGANVWLVVPNDEGVFHGAAEVEGIPCVHPLQAYLDLGAHPERAAEAAKKLRATHLTWSTDA